MAKDKPVNYKFRDLKIFGSTEWLANNEKKYRLVYDESECTFIYCELSFYNKLFDEQNWDVRISLKCVNNLTGEEVCSLTADRTIRKDENIVYVREGWGVKTASTYWKKGVYRWEAWIDNIFVAEKLFYIEDQGIVSDSVNPYFNINAIRLYEGPDANVVKKERKYVLRFGNEETRYVWLEFLADNLVKNADEWHCELFFYFRTHSGQLKGTIEKLLTVNRKDSTFDCTVGWGSDQKGTWGDDSYYIDIVFMDQLIASVPFEVGAEFVEDKDANRIVAVKPKVKIELPSKQQSTNV